MAKQLITVVLLIYYFARKLSTTKIKVLARLFKSRQHDDKIITDSQFKKISSTSTPSGIAALCNIPRSPYIDFKVRKWIYLDKIRDPGNLGTILRSALWFGFKNIILSSKSVDPYNPKAIRSGMGSHFGLNLYQNIRLNDFIKTHLIVSGSTCGEDISVFKLPEKYVLVLGNEAHGISKNIEPLIQKSVSIKRLGEGESLNLSSAASILMYSFTRKSRCYLYFIKDMIST